MDQVGAQVVHVAARDAILEDRALEVRHAPLAGAVQSNQVLGCHGHSRTVDATEEVKVNVQV